VVRGADEERLNRSRSLAGRSDRPRQQSSQVTGGPMFESGSLQRQVRRTPARTGEDPSDLEVVRYWDLAGLRGAPAFLHPWPERVRGSPRLRREKPVHSRRTAWSVQRTAWPAAAAEPAAAGSARQRIRLDVGARLLGTASIREVSSGQPCGMVRLPALGNRAPGSRCAGRGNASSGCVGGG